MLKEFLQNISEGLSDGIPNFYTENPLAISIREDGKRIIESLLPDHYSDYKVEGSAGRGRWAVKPSPLLKKPLPHDFHMSPSL